MLSATMFSLRGLGPGSVWDIRMILLSHNKITHKYGLCIVYRCNNNIGENGSPRFPFIGCSQELLTCSRYLACLLSESHRGPTGEPLVSPALSCEPRVTTDLNLI